MLECDTLAEAFTTDTSASHAAFANETWRSSTAWSASITSASSAISSTSSADRDPVDDLVQETWLRVLERGGSYNGRSRFEPWLFAIARNLTLDHLRKRRDLQSRFQCGCKRAIRAASRSRAARLHRALALRVSRAHRGRPAPRAHARNTGAHLSRSTRTSFSGRLVAAGDIRRHGRSPHHRLVPHLPRPRRPQNTYDAQNRRSRTDIKGEQHAG